MTTRLSEPFRRLLLTLLINSTEVSSWGITDINITDDVLSFCVNGFKYQGQVKLSVSNSDHFTIQLGSHSFENVKLVDVFVILDSAIEQTDSYNEDLQNYIQKRLTPSQP
jgi:hypothetical protein